MVCLGVLATGTAISEVPLWANGRKSGIVELFATSKGRLPVNTASMLAGTSSGILPTLAASCNLSFLL